MNGRHVVDRNAVLTQYRRLRAISKDVNNAALSCSAPASILEAGRRLGLVVGGTLICDSEEEQALVFDLVMHGHRPGRSSAIERYARTATPPPDTDEARMLNAIRDAHFSVWQFVRRHDVAGLIVKDVVAKTESWLMDLGLSSSGEPGFAFAARLCRPAEFAMTCGIIVPVDEYVLRDAVASVVTSRSAKPSDMMGDPRLVVAIYRSAIDAGVMDNIRYRDPALAA
jgi:hypothetical protein